MPQVISCPNCAKKLAVRDELKGRALICPQCKGRFTVPADNPQPSDSFDVPAPKSASAGAAGMDFLDDLAPAPRSTAKSAGTAALGGAAQRPAASRAQSRPGGASRAAASRAKKKSDQMMMIYIGGGIGAVILIVIIAVGAILTNRDSKASSHDVGVTKFGLSDSRRHHLFEKLITAVDEYGITKACKDEWYQIADEYKLDHSNIKAILDEGFARDDWEQPAPASITNKNRATRMEWIAQRHNGPDPILGL